MSKELNKLVSKVTLKEGKKVSVSIGNVREVLCILKKLCKKPADFHILISYLLGK